MLDICQYGIVYEWGVPKIYAFNMHLSLLWLTSDVGNLILAHSSRYSRDLEPRVEILMLIEFMLPIYLIYGTGKFYSEMSMKLRDMTLQFYLPWWLPQYCISTKCRSLPSGSKQWQAHYKWKYCFIYPWTRFPEQY
jgi:hypothetical protein